MYKKSDLCIQNAFDNEMLFVLMARDVTAPAVVVDWIGRNIGKQPAEKLHHALDAAIEMYNRQPEFSYRKEKARDHNKLRTKLRKSHGKE
jgi:hypothetical protein